MPFTNRQNLSLIIGLSLPIAMVLFVALAIYIPALFANPQTDFVYAIGNPDYYRYDGLTGEYTVQNGTITRNPPVYPPDYPRPTQDVPSQLYYHDVSENKSRQIGLEEARQFTLDPVAMSADGYEVVRGRGGGDFFPFMFSGGYDYNSVYMVGHNTSVKMNIPSLSPNNYVDFRFIGWVVQ